MYLRIAVQTCERFPEKITCENAFKAEKSWPKMWSEVGFDRSFSADLEGDFASCECLVREAVKAAIQLLGSSGS
jgi:hypothetical protein